MTFEEFFSKKKINLAVLQTAEPGLFAEFKTHYEQMGEKSFDHTKKYWFNKIRRQYNLPPEIKTEKLKIENQLAEQTVTESLEEITSSAPKLGFTPKFRAAAPKPVEDFANKQEETAEKPKLGFTSKFRAATPPKPTESTSPEDKEENLAAKPKLGFTPK